MHINLQTFTWEMTITICGSVSHSFPLIRQGNSIKLVQLSARYIFLNNCFSKTPAGEKTEWNFNELDMPAGKHQWSRKRRSGGINYSFTHTMPSVVCVCLYIKSQSILAFWVGAFIRGFSFHLIKAEWVVLNDLCVFELAHHINEFIFVNFKVPQVHYRERSTKSHCPSSLLKYTLMFAC